MIKTTFLCVNFHNSNAVGVVEAQPYSSYLPARCCTEDKDVRKGLTIYNREDHQVQYGGVSILTVLPPRVFCSI